MSEKNDQIKAFEGLDERRVNTFCWKYEDVARELGVSERHVQKLVGEDRIPFSKVGRLVRFSPGRVAEWLAKGGNINKPWPSRHLHKIR